MRIFKVVLAILVVALLVSFGVYSFQLGAASSDSTLTDITITEGMSRADVASLLFSKDLIKNETAFTLYARLNHSNFLAGPYELAGSDSVAKIVEKLSTGDFKTTNITFIEGWRATDMEKYLVETKKLTQFKGFAATGAQYEGYLFPDTYNIRVDETTAQLITELRDNFTKRTAGLGVDTQVLTVASIVEREANTDVDRTAIAAVYLNRLKIGMTLDADPTVQYAKGNWQAVTLSEYKSVISPYNTYLHAGLPPTPISNPGLKSIQAALNPDKSDYLYFFTAGGKTYYSKTLQEHEAKIALYF